VFLHCLRRRRADATVPKTTTWDRQ
jgi:hypothetical protein